MNTEDIVSDAPDPRRPRRVPGGVAAALTALAWLLVCAAAVVLLIPYVAVVSLAISGLDENPVGSMGVLGAAAVPLVLGVVALIARKRPAVRLVAGQLALVSVVAMLLWLMWGWWELGQ